MECNYLNWTIMLLIILILHQFLGHLCREIDVILQTVKKWIIKHQTTGMKATSPFMTFYLKNKVNK